MKMMILKTGMLLGGAGVLGYMYLKKHPEVICMVKQTMKEVNNKMLNSIE